MAIERIMDHVMVPTHVLIPKDKVEELIKRYGVSLKNIAVLSREDPMVEELNAEQGDLIKIERNSLTAEKAVYFRVVG